MKNLRPLKPGTRRAILACGVILIVTTVAAIAVSIPVRAGPGGAGGATIQSAAAQEIEIACRAVVDPMKLPATSKHPPGRAIPLRVPDPVRYQQIKSAVGSGAFVGELPLVTSVPLITTTAVAESFIGLASQESCGGCEPPDTHVAAGPSHVVEVDNVEARIFDKTGVIVTSFGLNGFFGLGATIFTSDPKIRFDTLADRWYISMLSLDSSTPRTSHNGQLDLAVSTSSDPTQPFNIYTFPTSANLPDQPQIGFNNDKLVIAANAFSCHPNCNSGGFQGVEFVVWNKAQLLAGYECHAANRNCWTRSRVRRAMRWREYSPVRRSMCRRKR